MKTFLMKKGITLSPKEYFVTALSYMALGLFSSLIIGVILKTIGAQLSIPFLMEIGNLAIKMMGPAIGVAVAYGLKAPPLVLFSAMVAGMAGGSPEVFNGGPAGSFVSALIATEFGKLVSKETKLDIIVTPFVTIVIGFVVAKFVGPVISSFMLSIGEVIVFATEQRPLLMGIIVATVMGLALTAPISSVAIAIMLQLDGVAAGAATVGCAAQMIGFATISYKENGFGGFIAQGLGTSMLQVANIVKNPLILIPPTVAGILLSPVATLGLLGPQMINNAAGAGMGTSGLVGQIMTFTTMGFTWHIFSIVIVLHLIGPAIISLILSSWMRKRGLIKQGDLKLSL
ncbi:PTS sugar transporter subunit IIC [Lottiidibacillus patelloidae]|uniref:PTS sugar transporter subunit IIC n=1 Tax=Lottiidibacillus patelloidae TaxID=2670334 RepID=A0A263BQY0_9BACI|nr:PTS sugar transporter subunit IIC [Lottiidibacillus patelloidae]OZM56084.1 PTS sugar transporter subunit IIC [Lottiidibacillus patelloidae]